MTKAKERKQFHVGDIVGWKSQSAGHVKLKSGQVVEVVPAFCDASDYNIVTGGKYTLPSGGFGEPRNHESYLVAVRWPAKHEQQLYWPVVSLLRLEAAAEKEGPERKELPGIPPPGPLSLAAQQFLDCRRKVHQALEILGAAKAEVVRQLKSDGLTKVVVEDDTKERYRFEIEPTGYKLKMSKVKDAAPAR